MAPTIPTQIWLALRSRIETLPLTPKPPVAYPASSFTPGASAFIAVGLTVATPRRVMIGAGEHDRSGTLTLSYADVIGKDYSVYAEKAGQIAAHFAEDTAIRYGGACVKVVSAPQPQEGFRDQGWWRMPVVIRWTTSR